MSDSVKGKYCDLCKHCVVRVIPCEPISESDPDTRTLRDCLLLPTAICEDVIKCDRHDENL